MISIIIPVFNEEENIKELQNRLSKVLFKEDYEIIFIDDGSKDHSEEIINELSQKDSKVQGIILSRNFGHQFALTAGMDFAKGDAVIMMDADLQHPPELIPQFIEYWRKGYDIVYSVRKDSSSTFNLKVVTSKMFYSLFKKLSGLDIPLGAADFRLLSRPALNSLKSCHERTRFLRGLVSWIGYKKIGLDYAPRERFAGVTKYPFRSMMRFALEGICSFSSIPLNLSVWMGFIVSLIGFAYGLYAIWSKLFTNQAMPGWTSTLVSVLFLGGVQLISIGIIGSYLSRIYEEVKQRPLYVVRTFIGKPQ
jgi:glycosyltransferase involved in cell wall biosynthesis